jgi:hypothetical protein
MEGKRLACKETRPDTRGVEDPGGEMKTKRYRCGESREGERSFYSGPPMSE